MNDPVNTLIHAINGLSRDFKRQTPERQRERLHGCVHLLLCQEESDAILAVTALADSTADDFVTSLVATVRKILVQGEQANADLLRDFERVVLCKPTITTIEDLRNRAEVLIRGLASYAVAQPA